MWVLYFQVHVSTEMPAKDGVFDGGVANFLAGKLALSQRTRRDDFKLAVSDASSMKGLSTMQKETKMKTFLASLSIDKHYNLYVHWNTCEFF